MIAGTILGCISLLLVAANVQATPNFLILFAGKSRVAPTTTELLNFSADPSSKGSNGLTLTWLAAHIQLAHVESFSLRF
jgi:hypothetical protein